MKLLGTAILVLAAVCWWPRQPDPLHGLPRVFVWAWERPEDLRFTDPRTTGIAFLDRTVFLENGSVRVRPRLQPLLFPPGATLMAVVRVEPRGLPLPPVEAVAAAIEEAGRSGNIRAVQVDFDARLSERSFYRQVLWSVRRALPPAMPLSITALASWCESDTWIAGLPVAEAVPMLFRMGPGEHPARSFRLDLCRSSAGLSRDEPLREPPSAARLYLFSPRSWTPTDFESALREARRWH